MKEYIFLFLFSYISFSQDFNDKIVYWKVASSNMSYLEAQAGIYWLLMKGIFDVYILQPFDKKSIFELLMSVHTHNFTVGSYSSKVDRMSSENMYGA